MDYKNGRTTLFDIAKKAGISPNSVSRALRGCSNISKKTQQRVRQIADELGYITNSHAQFLRQGRFKVIGIVYDNFSNPYYSIVTGLVDTLIRERNYRSMVFNEYNKDNVLGLTAAREMISFSLSGVITFILPTPEVIALFRTHGIPLIIIGRNGSNLGIDSVSSNDYRGGQLAGEALLKMGGRDFYYLGASDNLSVNLQRMAGYQDALKHANYTLCDDRIFHNNNNIATSQVIDAALKKFPRLDSIFCFNDLMAFETVNSLMERGLRVPEDVNVIGYDNLQKEINYPFRLTTVDGDKETTATRVVEILFGRIFHPETNGIVTEIVDVSLCIGKTTSEH